MPQAGGMQTMRRFVVVLGALAVSFAACAGAEPGAGPDEGASVNMAVAVSALTSTCSGQPGTDPTKEISRLRVTLTGPDTAGNQVIVAETDVNVGGKETAQVSLGSIPVSMNDNLTLLGYAEGAADDDPSWFGRRRQVPILEDQTNAVDILLARFGRFTCLSDATNSFTNRVFAATTRLGDGKVLITGGFEHSTANGSNSSLLDGASDKAFLYDPATGTLAPTGLMTKARAGHAAVYLPLSTGEIVLVFGGATRVTMSLAGGFPFALADEDGLNDYEVYHLTGDLKGTFTAAGNDKNGNPKQMLLKRAFLAASRLYDNTVLITGGGIWPKDGNPDYQKAEIWSPDADGGVGGMLELTANRPVMAKQHNGAGVAKLEDTKEGLSRYLIVGGTTDTTAAIEVYTQSSAQKEGVSGVFKVLDAGGNFPALYFPTVTKLKADGAKKRFLVVGGATVASGKLAAPASNAYVLSIDATDHVTTTVIPTDCSARFFHTASANYEATKVTVLGGFKDLGGTANGDTCFFDLATSKWGGLASGKEAFLTRGGHAAEMLSDDTLLLVGGMVTSDTLATDGAGFLELYAPTTIKLDLTVP